MSSLSSTLIFSKMKTKLKSKRFVLLCSLILVVGYSMTTNVDMELRARELLEERERLRDLITIDKGGGACDIGSPVEDAPLKPSADTTKTLLVSYPGSGKRFTWTVIKALTNYEVADDWNFSGKLFQNPLAIKTSWPHKEGKWSWGTQMDQVLLLMRNPRRAIPSYHTMRWELDYAKTWEESLLRIPDTYRERPSVEQWEIWRDVQYNSQIDAWFDFYDFWMQAGFMEDQNETHSRCIYSEIDCQPKEIVDFENLYTDSPTADFLKIGDLLDASQDVEVIASQARACVLQNVFNRTGHQDLNMHQGSRPFPDLPLNYTFTLLQLGRMCNRTIELRNKYSIEPLSLKPSASYFVEVLNKYIDDNLPEFYETVDAFLEEFVTDTFGDTDCSNLPKTEAAVCVFMKSKENHDVFSYGFCPDDFPYEDWLKERSILVQMYLDHGGSAWGSKSGWLGSTDHCKWEGVTCADIDTENEYQVVELSLPSNQISGSFPSNLHNLDELEVLDVVSNSLIGTVPNDMCAKSLTDELFISADAKNCPNDFDVSTGEYLEGCCDSILIDGDMYLDQFVVAEFGDTDCAILIGTEVDVCEFMSNKANHEIFADGYPEDFTGVWDWLQEKAVAVRSFFNDMPSVVPSAAPSMCSDPTIIWKQLGEDFESEGRYDENGHSVSLSNDGMRIAIGAIENENDNGDDNGHVRIFDYNEEKDSWVQLGQDLDGEASDDEFGYSVSLSGDGNRVAIGAPRNDGNGSKSGHVRIFNYDEINNIWVQLGQDIDGEASYDRSGYSVYLSGDGNRVAVGAPKNDGNGTRAGHVLIFDYDEINNSWVQLGQDIDGEGRYDYFGYSVSLSNDGNILAAGAPYNDGNDESGHVRIFEYDENFNIWVQLGHDIDGETSDEESGHSVSLSNNGMTVAIGAVYNHDGNFNNITGSVRVFNYEDYDDSWVQMGQDIDGEGRYDYFGFSVSLSNDGNRLAVGAPYNNGNDYYSGHVRIFDYDEINNIWIQLGHDIDGEAYYEYSGHSVSLSKDGTIIASGAPYGHYYNGTVRVYQIDSHC